MGDNVALVLGIYEGLGAGDPSNLLAALAPDVTWNTAEHMPLCPGRTLVGPDAVMGQFFGPVMQTFGPTFRIEIARLVDAGDTVVMQGRYRGVVQETGRELDVASAHVWDVEGGKVVRFQQYTDSAGYAETMQPR